MVTKMHFLDLMTVFKLTRIIGFIEIYVFSCSKMIRIEFFSPVGGWGGWQEVKPPTSMVGYGREGCPFFLLLF